MKLFIREKYLKKIRGFYHAEDIIKVITGVRCWANNVLKQYIMQGYAVNQKRLNALGSVVKLLQRTERSLDAKQVLTVVENKAGAFSWLQP